MSGFTYPPGAAGLTGTNFTYPPATSGGAVASAMPGAFVLSWPAAAGAVVANGTYQLPLAWPWQGGAITGIVARCATGSFTVAAQVNGVAVPGLGAVLVNSPTAAATAAGANAVAAGNAVTLAISGAAGSPTDATVQVTYTHSPT